MESAVSGPHVLPAGVEINVTGNGDNRIAGRDLYDLSLHVERIAPPKVVVKTGDGVLDAAQKAVLKRLVLQMAEDSSVKAKPRTVASVWAQLNRYMKVNSYAEIRQADFDKAVASLRRGGAIYRSARSAPRKLPTWRPRRIAAIQTRCKELGLEAWRMAYMKEKFGKESMIDMGDEEIESLYRAVMSKRGNR
jgi:hypothetical protein